MKPTKLLPLIALFLTGLWVGGCWIGEREECDYCPEMPESALEWLPQFEEGDTIVYSIDGELVKFIAEKKYRTEETHPPKPPRWGHCHPCDTPPWAGLALVSELREIRLQYSISDYSQSETGEERFYIYLGHNALDELGAFSLLYNSATKEYDYVYMPPFDERTFEIIDIEIAGKIYTDVVHLFYTGVLSLIDLHFYYSFEYGMIRIEHKTISPYSIDTTWDLIAVNRL